MPDTLLPLSFPEFPGYAPVEVRLRARDDFLKVKETLTRIGIPSLKRKELYQTCHILHKRGRYFILHFKELFALDKKPVTLTLSDLQRRNTIAALLCEWNMVELVNPASCAGQMPVAQVKILSFAEKSAWALIPKYNIGIPLNRTPTPKE